MGVLLFEVQTADFALFVSKTQKICHKIGNNWQFLADLRIFLVNLQASKQTTGKAEEEKGLTEQHLS